MLQVEPFLCGEVTKEKNVNHCYCHWCCCYPIIRIYPIIIPHFRPPLLYIYIYIYIYIYMLDKYSIKCSFGLYILLSVNFPITLSSYFWCMQHIAPLRLCLACSHFPLVCFFASLPLFVSYVSMDFVSLSIMPLKPLCSLLHLVHWWLCSATCIESRPFPQSLSLYPLFTLCPPFISRSCFKTIESSWDI